MKVGKTYWFVNLNWPTYLPYEVTIKDISRNVVMFDKYVGNEKFAEKNEIKKSLFETEIDAKMSLINYLRNHGPSFISEKEKEQLFNDHPEAFL